MRFEGNESKRKKGETKEGREGGEFRKGNPNQTKPKQHLTI